MSAAERADLRRAAELKAYEEHRLRYIMMPSRFVHKGTHEEYLLEKDEELNLPDFYLENELTALPIDPYRFYLYWDFDEETLFDVRSWLAEDYAFSLRVHDVTALVFNGQNAHRSWEEPCQPLVREWYLNTPISGSDLLIELGVQLTDGFRPLLRSNPLYIPPASVSPVIQDQFVQFVPAQPLPTDTLQPVSLAAEPVIMPRPETSAHTFFQEYVPTPEQFNPLPPPRQILTRWEATPPVSEGPPPFVRQQPAAPTWQPAPQDQAPAEPNWVPVEIAAPAPVPVPVIQASPGPEPLAGSSEEAGTELWQQLRAGGREAIQEWLGVPHEIRWLSDLPIGVSPVFFEQWISDPYDRAVMISYGIWPWEFTEYLPLGASDWTLRKFLGASLFSWYRPGGSERMIWWQQPVGASDNVRWLRPLGASEQSWSGSWQPERTPERSTWALWPVPASGRGGLSGRGGGVI